MFDFLFKRTRGQTKISPKATQPVPAVDSRTHEADQARKSALDRAQALNGDEASTVEFILKCEFAEARLVAAEKLISRPMLERVQHAMRKSDRRVSKLMQSKLDALTQQEQSESEARDCLGRAHHLLQGVQLAPNQVADLDRAWLPIARVPDELRAQFESVRILLRNRLEAQAALQRAVMDVLAQLNRLMNDSAAATPFEMTRSLALLEHAMARHTAEVEATSVPKHLFAEFSQKVAEFKLRLVVRERDAAAMAAREEALLKWETTESSALQADAIKREWRALPTVEDEGILAAMQERFEAVLTKIVSEKRPELPAIKEVKQASAQQVLELIEKLESAVQDGSLQAASEIDKKLRLTDFRLQHLSEEQSSRLAWARAELARLQGWAKWGGNISREELLKAVEALPTQSLGALELAKKVGSLRERWKSLDGTAGAASSDLWRRFDAACTTAYAPAAEHFKRLAEERQANAERAKAFIIEARQFAAAVIPKATDVVVDWKALAAFCAKMPLQWHKLGTIDRKEKKQLDAEFSDAMQPILEVLAEQRAIEKKRREKLIEETAGLNPKDRNVLDNLRALQERWQVQTRTLPLEHRDEQAFWLRFRETCDAVFAKRKELAGAADADRKQNMLAKEALCEQLESQSSANEKQIVSAIREAKEAWSSIGEVPRALEDKIEKRYKDAVLILQRKLSAQRKNAVEAEFAVLKEKLRVCQSIEETVEKGALPDQDALRARQTDWEKIPQVRPEFERATSARFNRAMKALQEGDSQYAAELLKNREAIAQKIMRLEIALGIHSPAALANDRLKLQVEVLQSSLKAGVKAPAATSLTQQVADLCGCAAAMDRETTNRLTQILESFKRAEN